MVRLYRLRNHALEKSFLFRSCFCFSRSQNSGTYVHKTVFFYDQAVLCKVIVHSLQSLMTNTTYHRTKLEGYKMFQDVWMHKILATILKNAMVLYCYNDIVFCHLEFDNQRAKAVSFSKYWCTM